MAFEGAFDSSLDAKQWQNILIHHSLGFNIYMIKPSDFNHFVLEKINGESIERKYFDYDVYFRDYIKILEVL